MSMNPREVLNLLQDNFATIEVVFGIQIPEYTEDFIGTVPKKPVSSFANRKTHTYKIPKDLPIAEGDTVVVYSHAGIQVATVTEVHLKAKRPEGNEQLDWIISRVDTTEYDAAKAKEAEVLEMLEEAERVHQREQMKEKLASAFPEGSAARSLFEAATQALKYPGLAVEEHKIYDQAVEARKQEN